MSYATTIAAMARNLISYQDRHGLDTVQDIIGRWAPPAENKTGVYAAAVAKELGVKAADRLDLNDEATLTKLTQAIVRHENGKQPYSDGQIAAGVKAAIEGRAIRPTAEQIDAARAANLAAHADGNALSAAGDIAAANAHIRAMEEAARLMDRGEPVRVADLVEAGRDRAGSRAAARSNGGTLTMAARISLDEFMRLPISDRRERFDGLAVADQLAFVELSDSIELILGGYPSAGQLLAALERPSASLDDVATVSGTIH